MSKYTIRQDTQKIDDIGDESEAKGRKAINQYARVEEKRERDQLNSFMAILDARKHSNDYNQRLARILDSFLLEEELEVPWKIWWDTKGVIMDVYIGKTVHRRAFKACREPAYDLNACKNFAVSTYYLLQSKRNGSPDRNRHPQP